MHDKDFVGGIVGKNPPASAGDMGLIPGLERFHIRWSNWACALELRATAPESPRACAPQHEKPPQWGACSPQLERAPTPEARESPHAAMETQCSHK